MQKSGKMLDHSEIQVNVQAPGSSNKEAGEKGKSPIFHRRSASLIMSQIRIRLAFFETQKQQTVNKSVREVRDLESLFTIQSNTVAAAKVVEVISLIESGTDDEGPQGQPYPWDSIGQILQPPFALTKSSPRVNSGRAPPVKGFFPALTPRVRAPLVFPISQNPSASPNALDAGGHPYPSPYATYIPGRTILDYDVAKARSRTPLAPTELRTEAEKYHNILEHDLSVTSDRLARANQKLADVNKKLAEVDRQKASADYTLGVQAKLLLQARKTIMCLEREADERIEAYTARMKEIKELCIGNLKAGSEFYMDLSEVPK